MKGSLMVCGTGSDAGKTHVVTGLCRLLARRGVRVAPFKAQNMSLNSFVTPEGHEIGRAEGVQALAAGVEPEVAMNPILMKPTGDRTAQVIVRGRPIGHLTAAEYHAHKPALKDAVIGALGDLRSRFDVVIAEGAGSPTEINLLEGDIVNLPIAAEARMPAIVVGDIDRGGVFASLYGTVALLPDEYRRLVKGFVMNKFRGDPALLGTGLKDLEARCGVPTLGVLPWLEGLALDAEDSLALSHVRTARAAPAVADTLDVAVIAFPYFSNFTDFDALSIEPGVSVRFVGDVGALGWPDLIVLPGSKSTVADLEWFCSRGLRDAVDAQRAEGAAVLGICAGYQMLGTRIVDEVESRRGEVDALGWLHAETLFRPHKVVTQRRGTALGEVITGYEIRHGETVRADGASGWMELDSADGATEEGCVNEDGQVLGTSLHGLFEQDRFRATFLAELGRRRNKTFIPAGVSFAVARQTQFDRLADLLDAHLDMAAVDRIIAEGASP